MGDSGRGFEEAQPGAGCSEAWENSRKLYLGPHGSHLLLQGFTLKLSKEMTGLSGASPQDIKV